MAETALNFGPDWLRALAHGSTSSQPPPVNVATVPKYSLAQFRYGREEMLALMPKDPKLPDCLKKDTSKIVRETFMYPLALTPATEDEQRLWSRSVNSDAVLRASGKSVPGSNMGRGRGGSVDRGRGRGRGGYYQRGITYEDSEDGPPSNFSRPKPIERSQSANEKDQRWDDRDRRFDRPFSGRGGGLDDTMLKPEQSRSSNEYWRKLDKDDDSDWRSSSLRSSDKSGNRGSWRNPIDKDRRDIERNPSSRSLNGNSRSSHLHQKLPGNHLPEWSVDESNEQDVVGTFDSSGAFLEPKMTDSSFDDIYVSDEADEGIMKDSPEAKKDNIKKTPKKSNQQSPMSVSLKQNAKLTEKHNTEDLMVEKHPPQTSETFSNSKTLTSVAGNKSADHVIKLNSVVQHQIVNNKTTDYIPVTLPNVPEVAESTKSESVILNHAKNSDSSVPSAAIEEDAFAHHKKATENMVAQWTEEEEQRVISQTSAPVQEKDIKWFYQDPQGEIQGPFTSPEMLEWFSAGYFTMSLMVRRAFDEKFSQLGELIKSWGRVPFLPGNSPPPIRVSPTSIPPPVTQTIVPNPVAASVSNQLPKQEEQLLAIQQQLLQQQLMQQQLLLRQAQLQQLLAQLKQQDNFTSLNSQQQQQVLMQHLMAQQQMPRPNLPGVSEQQPGLVETMTPVPIPLLGLPMAPLIKNDLSLWNVTPPSSTWPINPNTSQPSNTSIWDVDSKPVSEEADLEKQKRLVEDQERLRKAEEERLALEKEIEEKRKLDELRRKQEEERLLKELQKQEDEKRKQEELKHKEEEKRRLEELRRLEEQKRKEEELRKQREEELRRIEEQKRLEELKRLEEQRRLEEKRKEEELRKQEEQRKLEEKRKKEELQRKIEMEQERERIELERQREAARMKEIEREQQLQRERQKQKEREEELRRLAEIKLKSQGPAWGIQKAQSDTQLSLADIQRLQEEKEKEEREERLRQQLLQQHAIKQAQQSKNGLSWAKRSADSQQAVKSLAEIQQEEAERLMQQQRNQKPQAPAPVVNSNVGVWGNASHLNKITAAPPSWNINNVTTSGFWEDSSSISSSQVRKPTAKANDSAFPALTNPEKPATTVHSNKSKNVRAKKEEDAVTKLFGNRKPTDEFTAWCTEALSAMPSSVDVPTFVAFLKDIESPYEVHDYVKSYLGDGKEPREFAKQFLDRRSKFRAKQVPTEENILWGPAPAVNPVVNKSNSQPSNDNDGNSNAKGKSKRRKNRMQKLDSSMLGFTVQSNPDRLNVGEIDHVEGM